MIAKDPPTGFMKQCKRCGIRSDSSEFSRHGRTCSTCKAAYGRINGRANAKAWREANRERYRELMRSWRENNRAQRNEYQRRRLSKMGFFVRASEARRCAATALDLARLWKRQRGRCALSGRKLTRESAHLDHKTPICKGGSHDISNLQWLDERVNMSKNGLTDSEFIALCRKVVSTMRPAP